MNMKLDAKSKIYVIILNWNGFADTCSCLDSLLPERHSNLQLVVVDNASSDNSCAEIRNWAVGNGINLISLSRTEAESGELSNNTEGGLILIQTGANLGFAGGNNVGMRYALRRGAEYIWLLNNDTVVSPASLQPMLNAMCADHAVGIAGSCVLYYDRPQMVQTAGMKLGPFALTISHLGRGRSFPDSAVTEQREVDCVPACSLLVKKEVIADIGLIDEDYFMYHEDIDWQIKAKRAGWRIVYVPDSKILHKCGGSTKKVSYVSAYYQSRNKFLLIAKNQGILRPFLFLPLSLSYIRNVLRAYLSGERKAAWSILQGGKDFLLGRKGARNFHNG